MEEVLADERNERAVQAQPGVARARDALENHLGDVLLRVGVGAEFDDDLLRDAEVEGLEPDLHLERRDVGIVRKRVGVVGDLDLFFFFSFFFFVFF